MTGIDLRWYGPPDAEKRLQYRVAYPLFGGLVKNALGEEVPVNEVHWSEWKDVPIVLELVTN